MPLTGLFAIVVVVPDFALFFVEPFVLQAAGARRTTAAAIHTHQLENRFVGLAYVWLGLIGAPKFPPTPQGPPVGTPAAPDGTGSTRARAKLGMLSIL